MSFTVNDFEDLIRILEQQPLWLARLRGLVLPDQLLSLPDLIRALAEAQERTEQRLETLTIRVDALAEAQQRTEQRVAELAEAQQQAAVRLGELAEAQRASEVRIDRLAELYGRLATDVDWLKGESLELRFQRHGASYFGRIIRRTHVLSEDERWELLEAAEERGLLSRQQVDDLQLADLFVRGRRAGEPREVYLVVEVSWTIDEGDIERAARRAELLARTGVEAIPVVAGTAVATGVPERAREAGVWQVTNGRAEPPAA